jgi:hypothetical protein
MAASSGITVQETLDSAPAGVAPPPAVFHADARLETKVSLAEKNRPLGELLTGLSQQIGVRLTASSETADDKVTLYLDERPAAEALALVARQFGFQWKKSHSGYELTQDLPARAREAELRQLGRAGQVRAIQARLERVASIVATPREQWPARRSEIDRRLADPSVATDERARLAEEQAAFQDAERPGAAAAVAIYRSLTPAQLAFLSAGGEIRFATADDSLAPTLAEAVRHAAAQQMHRDAQRMVERMAGTGANPAAGPPPDAGPTEGEASVSIHYSTSGFRKGPPRPEGPPLQLQFALTIDPGGGNRRRLFPVLWSPMLRPPGAAAPATAAETEDPALRREVQLTFPGMKLPSAPADAPPAGGKGGFGPGKPPSDFFWPSDMPTLGDICEALNRTTGLEVIADSFIRDRIDATKVTGKQPLARILQSIADGLEYDWKQEGHLLRFRSRFYYQDRYAEVPDRILRPWIQRAARAGAPSLDDLAELAAALNDDQCSGMQEFWGWYLEKSGIPMPPGPADFADNRRHLRFWAALGPVQKRAVLAGAVLPVAQMNGLQQRAFQAALVAPHEGPPDQTELAHSPTTEELAAGGFSLQSRQLRQELATGTWPDGGQFLSLTRRPITEPPNAATLTGPNGISMQALGPPSLLNSYDFTYHLSGEPAPARTARIDVPGPQRQVPSPNTH